MSCDYHYILKKAREAAATSPIENKEYAIVLELERAKRTASYDELFFINGLISHLTDILMEEAEKSLKPFHIDWNEPNEMPRMNVFEMLMHNLKNN